MKSYLSLIPISAKVHRKESRMTIFCIILAVFLVTGIFSMADMEVRSQKIRIIQQYGEWHMQARGLSASDESLISARPDVSAAARYGVLNYRLEDGYRIAGSSTAGGGISDISGKQAVICGADESFVTDIMHYSIKSGSFPSAANEVMLTESANYAFNVSIGDTIEIETPSGAVSAFTVSGFGSDTNMTGSADAIGVFMPLDSFRQFYEAEAGSSFPDDYISFYIKFDENCDISRAIKDVQAQFDLDDTDISLNNMLLGALGESDHSYMSGLYMVAGVLFLLVLACGVLMIASSMNSNIAQKTEFFGMLRCIGASKKQIRRFVRLEALNWCKTAIPAGVALGIVITWFLCAVLRILSGSYFETMPVFGVSFAGIAAGIIVGLLTVLLAARSPAKKASKVSPLAAVSGNAEISRNIKKTAGTKFIKVETALGMHHAKQSKKNFMLMIGSFAASIILFFGFSAMVDFIYHGIAPLHPYSPDVSVISPGHFRTIDTEISDKLENLGFVKRAYGRMFCYNVSAELDIPKEASDVNPAVTLISYEEHQFDWARGSDIISGNKGAINQVMNESGYVLAAYNPYIPLQAGDKINTELGEVTVAAVLADLPFSFGIGTEPLICSESTFRTLTGDSAYTIVDIQLESDATDEDMNAVRALASENGAEFSDQRMANREARGIYYSFALFIYSFLAVIALITVFNIMNSISMSVSARIKQYGAMRAIGMSARQLTKMIAAEAMTYGICGSIAGCLLGLPLNKFVFENLITSYFGDPWSVPLSTVTIVIPFTAAASLIAVRGPAKRIKNMSITETIHA